MYWYATLNTENNFEVFEISLIHFVVGFELFSKNIATAIEWVPWVSIKLTSNKVKSIVKLE